MTPIQIVPTNVSGFKVNQNNILQKWLSLTYPIHKLTDKEIDVAAIFLRKYFENKEKIINEELLNKVTFSTESKRSVREELNMTPTYFQIILRGLKEKEFIKNGLINPKFIPSFNSDGNILHLFILKNESVSNNSAKT
jgi:hypothetical protein